MGMIKGITIKLYEKTKTGEDAFGHPIFEETPVEVNNVLVAPVTSEAIITDQDLQGKRGISAGHSEGRHARVEEQEGRILRENIQNGECPGRRNREPDPARLEQKSEGGTV